VLKRFISQTSQFATVQVIVMDNTAPLPFFSHIGSFHWFHPEKKENHFCLCSIRRLSAPVLPFLWILPQIYGFWISIGIYGFFRKNGNFYGFSTDQWIFPWKWEFFGNWSPSAMSIILSLLWTDKMRKKDAKF